MQNKVEHYPRGLLWAPLKASFGRSIGAIDVDLDVDICICIFIYILCLFTEDVDIDVDVDVGAYVACGIPSTQIQGYAEIVLLSSLSGLLQMKTWKPSWK